MKGWSSCWNYERIKARAWSRKILEWGYWVWPQISNSKNLWSSGYPVESIPRSSSRRDNLSKFKFRNERNGANTNWGRNFLLLNKTLSAFKRLPHFLTINSLNLAFLFRPKLFLYLGVVSSLEEDKEVSWLSFSFWNDLVLLFPIKFRNSAYGYWMFFCVYEWERPIKNTEDNYEDRGFWDANYIHFLQQKTLLAYIKHFENLHKFCLQYVILK